MPEENQSTNHQENKNQPAQPTQKNNGLITPIKNVFYL